MLPLTTITLHSILSATNMLVSKKINTFRNDTVLLANVLSYIAVWSVGLIASLYMQKPIHLHLVAQNWFYFLVIGTLFPIKTFLFLKVFRFVPTTVGAILSMLHVVAAIVASAVFLNDILTTVQLLGSCLVLCAIYISHPKAKTKKQMTTFTKGIGLALVSSIIFGIAITAEKYLLTQVGLQTYIATGWLMQCIGGIIMALFLRKKYLHFPKNTTQWRYVSLYAILTAVSGLLFVISQTYGKSSAIINSLGGMKVVFAAILSYVVYKNKHVGMRLIVSSMFCVVGVILLTA